MNSTPNKINVNKAGTTSSKGSRFKILKDKLEEDVAALENRIREKSKTAGALLNITNGEGSNKHKKENAKGKLKTAFKLGKSFSIFTGKIQKQLKLLHNLLRWRKFLKT
ncbi:hypothetical protein ACOSQ3_027633 [Xanthoceras sorbifolium]